MTPARTRNGGLVRMAQRNSPIVLVVLLLVLGAVAVWRVSTTRAAAAESGAEVSAQLERIISAHPVYVNNSQYIDNLFSWAHEQAFDEHFQLGFLALRPHFDHPQYVEDVFAMMAQQARGDGADSVAEAMELIGENIDVDSPLLFSHPEDA